MSIFAVYVAGLFVGVVLGLPLALELSDFRVMEVLALVFLWPVTLAFTLWRGAVNGFRRLAK